MFHTNMYFALYISLRILLPSSHRLSVRGTLHVVIQLLAMLSGNLSCAEGKFNIPPIIISSIVLCHTLVCQKSLSRQPIFQLSTHSGHPAHSGRGGAYYKTLVHFTVEDYVVLENKQEI